MSMGYKTQLSALGGAIALAGSFYSVGKTAIYTGKFYFVILLFFS